MTRQDNEGRLPDVADHKETEQQPVKVELQPVRPPPRASDRDARPGKWATIGCGMGIVVLVAALFAGSGLNRRAIWAGFAGARQRLVANLPGDLPPGERMELTRRLEALSAELERRDDPYPAMGELQRLVRTMLEDGRISRDELEGLDLYLESQLPTGAAGEPGAMP